MLLRNKKHPLTCVPSSTASIFALGQRHKMPLRTCTYGPSELKGYNGTGFGVLSLHGVSKYPLLAARFVCIYDRSNACASFARSIVAGAAPERSTASAMGYMGYRPYRWAVYVVFGIHTIPKPPWLSGIGTMLSLITVLTILGIEEKWKCKLLSASHPI